MYIVLLYEMNLEFLESRTQISNFDPGFLTYWSLSLAHLLKTTCHANLPISIRSNGVGVVN